MGFKVLGSTEEVMKGHGPRRGLEGPFVYANGRILYYSTTEGQYWDPTTDWFVPHEEVVALQNQLFDVLKK